MDSTWGIIQPSQGLDMRIHAVGNVKGKIAKPSDWTWGPVPEDLLRQAKMTIKDILIPMKLPSGEIVLVPGDRINTTTNQDLYQGRLRDYVRSQESAGGGKSRESNPISKTAKLTDRTILTIRDSKGFIESPTGPAPIKFSQAFTGIYKPSHHPETQKVLKARFPLLMNQYNSNNTPYIVVQYDSPDSHHNKFVLLTSAKEIKKQEPVKLSRKGGTRRSRRSNSKSRSRTKRRSNSTA
jgi:hypothetical protein